MNDLTKGSIKKEFITLAIPLIAGNILQQLYNAVDAFMIGRFSGQEEFAAIGVAGTVMNLFLFAIVGACTGLSVLFARCYGTGDYDKLKKQHFTALLTGLMGTIVLCIISLLGIKGILFLLQTPQELSGYVTEYMRWISMALPFAFLYNMYASALRASGNTLASLLILAASVVANLCLDFLFVGVFRWGIRGAAEATFFTQCISAVLCIFYLIRCRKEMLIRKSDCKIDACLARDTIKCSIVTAFHQAGLYIGKMCVQGTVNTGGTPSIAAYTAATRIEGFINSFGDSGSAITSVLVSQNYGAKKEERVGRIFRFSMKLMAVGGILCGILLFLTAPMTIAWMQGSASGESVTQAVSYLRIVSVFYPLCFTGSTFTGFFNGVGKVLITFMGTIGQITFRVVASWLLFEDFKLCAVAAATGIGWFLANVFWAWNKHRFGK